MTTTPSVDQTLAEIVTVDPSSARVLEAFGLDYCCGGGRPLLTACAEAEVDPDLVLAALAEVAPAPRPAWADLGPADLVDHLEATHHAYLHTELPRLHALAEKVADVHRSRHPELAEVLATFEELRADLEPHLAKEEQILFPLIRALAGGGPPPEAGPASARGPIAVMGAEHDRAGALLARLRSLTDAYRVPDDACASYRALYEGLAELEADTHLHVHKENNQLFPAVVALEGAP